MCLFRSPFHPPTAISVSFRASRKPHFLSFNYLSSETSTIYTVHALLALVEKVRGDRRVFRLSPGSDGRGRKSTSGRRKNCKRFPDACLRGGAPDTVALAEPARAQGGPSLGGPRVGKAGGWLSAGDPRGAAPRAPHRARASLQGMPPLSPEKPALCAGCGGKIADRYYLLAVDKQWHLRCLKCCECKLALESELTCFAKDGSIYCKEDYYRYSHPIPSPPGSATSPSPWVPSGLPPAQGSPPRAPSNCSVITPARRGGRTPREGGHPRSRARSRLSGSGDPRSTAEGTGHVLGGSVNVSASTEAKAGLVCVFRLLRTNSARPVPWN